MLRQGKKQLFRFALIAPDIAQRRKKELIVDLPAIGFLSPLPSSKDAVIPAAWQATLGREVSMRTLY